MLVKKQNNDQKVNESSDLEEQDIRPPASMYGTPKNRDIYDLESHEGVYDENKSQEHKKSQEKLAVQNIPINKKWMDLTIDTHHIKVINPSYVDELEDKIKKLEHRMKSVEQGQNSLRRNLSTLSSDVNNLWNKIFKR